MAHAAGLGRPFAEFGELSPEAKAALAAQGFERATPVQEAVIPLFCGHKDVSVDAATGSGKTLAFVLPVVERLRRLSVPLKRHQVGAVVVSPTRELARQIFTVAQPFVATVPWLRALLLVGGSDPAADVASFKEDGGHVLIGTPGRLDDVMMRCSSMDLRTVEVLVLDEADRLLDMGFKRQLDALFGRLPRQRRTGLFSATQTEAVEALARAGLRNPVRVNVAVTAAVGGGGGFGGGAAVPEAVQCTPATLSIQHLVCEAEEKLPQLVAFLQAHKQQKVIVYFLTCACVDFALAALPRLPQLAGVAVRGLHGRMKQATREATLAAFAEMPAGVLLCTDVAARGLDIPDVHWILQFDPPQDPAAFVHRVGRTARMGRSGSALVLLLPHETTYVDFLKIRKVPLQEGQALPAPEGVLPALRRQAEGDRAIMDAGTRAFVSYIRAYKEHQCRFIFRLQDLQLGPLAMSFALLRLPRMPEVKRLGKKAVEGFEPSLVDPETVPFRDKQREKQRQALLRQRAAASEAAATVGKGGGGNAGGRQQQQQQQQQQAVQQQQQQVRLTAAKRRKLEQQQELDDLEEEYALYRKLKKGKISEHEYDVATGLSSASESEAEEGGRQRASGGGKGGGALVEEALRKKVKKAARKQKKWRALQQQQHSAEARADNADCIRGKK